MYELRRRENEFTFLVLKFLVKSAFCSNFGFLIVKFSCIQISYFLLCESCFVISSKLMPQIWDRFRPFSSFPFACGNSSQEGDDYLLWLPYFSTQTKNFACYKWFADIPPLLSIFNFYLWLLIFDLAPQILFEITGTRIGSNFYGLAYLICYDHNDYCILLS